METLPLLLLLVSVGSSQDCLPVRLPDLPQAYTANLQYNIASRDRLSMSSCRLLGNCASSSSFTLPEMGHSVTIKEMAEGRIARVDTFTEYQTESGDQRVTRDSIVWNPTISGIASFLFTRTEGFPKPKTSCLVDNLYKDSVVDWLLGLNPDCSSGNTTNIDCVPSIAGMLHTNGNYTWDSCTTVRGINSNLFKSHWSIPAWQAELNVKYYWSDITRWQSSDGKSVPVRCVIEGDAVDPDTGLSVTIADMIDFQQFFEVDVGSQSFQPVKDIMCEGRGVEDTLPSIPDAVEYGSELVFHWINPESGLMHKIISPRDNWYDHGMKLARTDYKPIDYKPVIFNHSNPWEGREGVQSDIQDFFAGLSYQIDLEFGNCTVKPIQDDANNQTIIDISDGRIQMSDPMHLFHMDQEFAYNGLFLDRSIVMGVFVGSTPITPGSIYNVSSVVSLSSAGYIIQDDGQTGLFIPARIDTYPTDNYNDPTKWVTTNIYRFSKQTPDFQDFDITPCFDEDHMMHLLIKMSWRIDEDLMEYKVLQRAFRAHISLVAQITPLRVQNIETIIEPGSSEYSLIFTIVDYPAGLPEIDLPEEATRPIDQCKKLILEAVETGSFTVGVPLNGRDGIVNSTATPGSLVEIDSRGGHRPPHATVTFEQGYSSGDMAGLAFGMILGGILMAGVIYFFALRNNVRAGIPVMRGFDNPLTGLSNLGTSITGLGK